MWLRVAHVLVRAASRLISTLFFPDIERALHSKHPEETVQALKAIAADKALIANEQVRRDVIALLDRESSDNDWEELAEMQPYEIYYGQLLETVSAIATATDDPAAWEALASANFNADSKYGRWLAVQAGAIPALIKLSTSKWNIMRGRTLEVMSYTIAACDKNTHQPVCEKRSQLLQIIRTHAETDAGVTADAIDALAVCGTEADILRLESLRTKFRDPKDVTNARAHLIDRAERMIRERLVAK